MNNPALPEPSDAQLSYEITLIQKHYAEGDCRIECPMFSELRECCTVLADDLALEECPAYEELLAEDMRHQAEDQEGCYAEDRFHD